MLLQVWLLDPASNLGRQAHSDMLIRLIDRLSDVILHDSILTQHFFQFDGKDVPRSQGYQVYLLCHSAEFVFYYNCHRDFRTIVY